MVAVPCQLIGSRLSWREGIVAESLAMQCLLDQVERIAPASLPVLLLGETGTGKELLARGLHEVSGRSGRFVPVNCAAIPAGLAESELFGHVRGAFTGAERSRVGLIEQADNGTLFLDEFTELESHIQAKLLRVVEDGLVRRVGSSVEVRVHVRVVAATNRDPAVELRAGRLREDLYYRLSGVTLSIPPLRDRPEDIKSLVEKFVAESARENGMTTPEVSAEIIAFLEQQPWPGNVRELRQAVHRAVILGGSVLQPEDFGLTSQLTSRVASSCPRPRSWRQAHRANLLLAIERHGSVSAAACELGVPKSTAYDWLRSCRTVGLS